MRTYYFGGNCHSDGAAWLLGYFDSEPTPLLKIFPSLKRKTYFGDDATIKEEQLAQAWEIPELPDKSMLSILGELTYIADLQRF